MSACQHTNQQQTLRFQSREFCRSAFRMSQLLRGVAAVAFGATIIAAADARPVHHTLQVGGPITVAETRGFCAARLTKFVEALDRELDTNPSTAGPILQVLQMHFPIERCDIDEAFKI